MAYRPDGEAIAICRELDRGRGYYSSLWLYDAITGDEDRLYDDRLLSFFWSPDGSSIALVVPSEAGEGSIRWATLGIFSGLSVSSKTLRLLESSRATDRLSLTKIMRLGLLEESARSAVLNAMAQSESHITQIGADKRVTPRPATPSFRKR